MKKIMQSMVFDTEGVKVNDTILIRYTSREIDEITVGTIRGISKTSITFGSISNGVMYNGALSIEEVEKGRVDFTILSETEIMGVIAISNGDMEEVEDLNDTDEEAIPYISPEITLPQLHAHVEQMGTQELGDLLRKVGEVLASRGAKFCITN